MGVDAKRLDAEGYGAEHPIASNETPEGRAQNRRIDIRVMEK
jgi:OOP family OmpA-OmpF porin